MENETELNPGHAGESGANSSDTITLSRAEWEALQAEKRSLTGKVNGLNGRVKTLTEQVNGYVTTLGQTNTDYEAKISELTTQLQQTQAAFTELDTKHKTIAAEHSQIIQWRDNRNAVREFAQANNAPQLIDAFDEGLLIGMSQLDETGRTDYLTKFAAKIGNMQQRIIEETRAGMTPRPPSQTGQVSKTMADHQSELATLARSKGVGSNEYKAAMNEYQQAIASGAFK